MAGDWIKVRSDLYRDPKVCLIADILLSKDCNVTRDVTECNAAVTRNIMRNAVVGALASIWGIFRHKGERRNDDLFISGLSISVIDDISEIPGFGDAMERTGWVQNLEGGIVFPRYYATYNVDPDERKRSKSAERQRKYRQRNKEKNSLNDDVTRDVTRDVTVTHREEKSREESICNTESEWSPSLSITQAVEQAKTRKGIPIPFSEWVYADWTSRDGRDAGGVQCKFLRYVSKRWLREQAKYESGKHPACQKEQESKPEVSAGYRIMGEDETSYSELIAEYSTEKTEYSKFDRMKIQNFWRKLDQQQRSCITGHLPQTVCRIAQAA